VSVLCNPALPSSVVSCLLLDHLFHQLSFSFSLHMFIYGVPSKLICGDVGVLLNFLGAVAKYAIYKSRKIKIDNGHGSDVISIFKGFVSTRLRLEFDFFLSNQNVKLFERKWCIANVLCFVKNSELVITL